MYFLHVDPTNFLHQILGRGSERECICGGLHHLLSMSLAVEAMMCFDDGKYSKLPFQWGRLWR